MSLEFGKILIFAMTLPGLGELLVILLILLLVFGAAKIPEIARSLGSGVREFKKAVKDDKPKNENKTKD